LFMSKSKVRHIATSYDGNVVAVGEFERKVSTWDLETKKRMADFDTVLDFGGRRLTVSRDGRYCAAGTYDGANLAENRYVGGSVAVYDTSTGEMLWQNKKIKRVQRLKFSVHSPGKLYAACGEQPLIVLESATGSVVEKFRDTDGIWESPYDEIEMREKGRGDFLYDSSTGKRIGQLAYGGLGPLDVAFSENYVVASYAGGLVTCSDTKNCIQVWHHYAKEGRYARISYNQMSHEFIAVDLHWTKGTNESIVWLDENTGDIKRRLKFTSTPWETEFALRGTVLVTSDGMLLDTSSGKEIAGLDFPRDADDLEPQE
jgi:outer membrane protein assembly factor BamB